MEEKNRPAVMGTQPWSAVTEEPLIGMLTLARTKFFNTLYVYHCVRAPGYVLEFSCRKGTLFHCCGCKRNGKTRCITVINGMIVPGVKHPEDDHHPRCQPLELSGTFSHYDRRKFSFTNRIVNIWNSLPYAVVDVESVDLFKSRLDNFWKFQDVKYD